MAKSPPAPTGAFGTRPPGAPHEVSQPLKPELIQEQLQQARAHEKTLKPLVFPSPGPPAPSPLKPGPLKPGSGGASLKPSQAVPSPAVPAPATPDPASLPPAPPDHGDPEAPPLPVAGEPDGEPDSLEGLEADFAAAQADQEPTRVQPAASETDSPARGVPHPIADPGKAITGGWGEGPPVYFALDGTELRALVDQLMQDLRARMATDLRFSLALCYPQVRCRVLVQIDGATAAAGINDVAFDLEEARIVTLQAQAADTEETPADALRDEAGLEKPRKHAVGTGIRKAIVDR